MLNRYLIGAGVVLAALAAGAGYGHYREGVGYDKRDQAAKIELGKRQTALYEAQVKLDKAVHDADQKNQIAKAETNRLRGDLADVSSRLRELTRPGVRPGVANESTGGTYATGPDWIGAFAACYAEYELLGGDAANTADQLRGLQEIIRAAGGLQ